jgi:hypothetical protein
MTIHTVNDICTHICKRTHVHICTLICTHTYVHLYVHTHMYTYMYTHICTLICTHTYVHTYKEKSSLNPNLNTQHWHPPLLLSPSVFFRHFRLTALLLSQGKIHSAFPKCYYFNFLLFLKFRNFNPLNTKRKQLYLDPVRTAQ